MFTEDQVRRLVDDGELSHEVAVPLLNLYVFPYDDWWYQVQERLYPQLVRKYGEEEAVNQVRDIVSFTILFPAYDRSVNIDRVNPENNLFKWMWFEQRSRFSWLEELKPVVKFDQQVAEWRKQVLQYGVIKPQAVGYQPLARQALKWLCDMSEEAEELTDEALDKFRKFVMAYGGASICYLFEQHRSKVNDVVNWRSPYFIERLLFKTYKPDEILEIKKKEFGKTNSDYIQQLEVI